MTRDDAMKVWRAAYTKHNATAALTNGDADEAAATVIQQAFAERGGEKLREMAAIPCQSKGVEDLEGGCCATCRARQALAAKGDSRGTD